jgi:hypothetical protein
MMQGVRVNSREAIPIQVSRRKKDLTDMNRKIAEAIPYWPESIDILSLARKFDFTTKRIRYRIDVFQDEYLIFQDGDRFSRLKRDYSNMEVV